MWKDGLLVGSRNKTVFSKIASFTEDLNGFDQHVSARISAHINHFEIAWRGSRHDGELPSGYHTEQDKEVVGPFLLYQIRVGPGKTPGYRAWVMFLDKSVNACWVYVFKKGKGRQPEDMRHARERALRHWEMVQKDKEKS